MNWPLTLRLFRLQLKLNWRNFAGRLSRDRGGWRSYLLMSLMGLALLPALFSLLGSGVSLYLLARAAGEPETALIMVMAGGQAVALLFGLFYVMSAFYFARDLKVLLPLPLRPAEIVAAKFGQVVFSEYLTMAAVVVPAFFAYGTGSGGLLFWPLALLIFLLLPVAPLALDGLLLLLLMRATAGRRLRLSRDLLRVLGALVAVALVFFLQWGARSRVSVPLQTPGGGRLTGQMRRPPPDLVRILFVDNRETLHRLGEYLPHVVWATRALSQPSSAAGALGLLGYLAVSLGLTALLLLLVGRMYVQAVQADTGGGRRAVASAGEVRAGLVRVRPPLVALLWREVALLLRTPLFLLNGVLALFLVPVATLGPLVANGGMGRFRAVLLTDPVLMNLLPAMGVGAALFLAVTGSISTTAISREGRRFWISRALPVDPGLQVTAKLLLGVLHSMVGATIIAGAMLLWVRAPLSTVLLMLAGALAASCLTQCALLIVDLVHPYLQWTDPQQAMKGNLNVIFGLLLAFAIIALLGGLAGLLYWANPGLMMPGLIVLSLAGAYALFRWDVRLARVRYQEIED